MRIRLFITSIILLSILFSCSSNEYDETLTSVLNKSELSTIQNNNQSKSGESELDPFLSVEFLPNSTARYLITEQLANLDFPIDAIGETNQINGSINFDENGKIIQQNSTIIVNVNSLKINPSKRLTTPADLASIISLIGLSEKTWMTGNTIRVDGGEDITG